MELKKMFRKNIFGGFNKKDVEEYIKLLEEELEKSRNNEGILSEDEKGIIDESIEEIIKLKNEREELEKQLAELKKKLEETERVSTNDSSNAENAELMIKLLADNKRMKDELKNNAEMKDSQEKDREAIKKVLADAKEQAQTMLLNAERMAEEKRIKANEELKNELENKVIEFVTINYRVADFIKEIESVRDQLGNVSESLKTIAQEVPAKVVDLLEEDEKKIVDEVQTK